MQLTIKLSDNLSTDKVSHIIKKIEKTFIKEGVSIEIESEADEDSWDKLDVKSISVDTGIEDFAENHDHYLYGLSKQS
ncbi:MAG: hypothetical protein HON94_06950 [Methylococcales bacterium]|jgi:uncharacterized FAD-dependent dehydrogenase|nr:hypothetical protein [Methylococcales bacterium]MBT7409410.1 hypothetical protein [Methylococcales bacterium]